MPYTDQSPFAIRCSWGARGPAALADCRTFIIVDILSFSTSVSIAVARGATLFPYPIDRDDVASYAAEKGAEVAGRRGTPLSLSPSSLQQIPSGTRLVLPSPNGSSICFAAVERGNVLVGSLRNRRAVAEHAMALGGPIGVIPAGERWESGGLRPALEDQIGAGAIIDLIPGQRSPEAEAAAGVFRQFADALPETLRSCCSGRELIERGFGTDVDLAAAVDINNASAIMIEDRIVSSINVEKTSASA